ncbi:alpha/beta fold hydrolase [Rhodococcus ruber]|uniref:Alpha/beta fold hydrolase n=1 Tax=Rhodococcus ruber TaxID=1830 RepID=A0ABT4MJV2_9NOCA|nr:alpha/beta fold hydrolase [Rhodococcus ruber]MCZ4521273.1 alpha/beta fold hydrolase [Rhodococcus ruber]
MAKLPRTSRIIFALSSAAALCFAGTATASAAPIVGPTLEGANDFGCVPSPEHPRPVVLLHGTKMDSTAWQVLAPQLVDEGYCVFAPNYGAVPLLLEPGNVIWGSGDIATSSREVAAFVDRVLAETGSTQVDMVGHSQGGLVARQYMKFDGGTDPADPALNKVHSLVTLGATNHGTTFGGLQQLSELLTSLGLPGDAITPLTWNMAGAQQLVGSSTLAKLNADGDVQPGVDYTVIATRDDTISTPPDGTFLKSGDGTNVHNVWVQDVCPSATTTHIGLIADPAPLYIVKSALDPAYAAGNTPPC